MAGRFKVRAKMPTFNILGFKTDLNKVGKEIVKDAAREWLKAVIVEIPTYTGAARGTFKPLGSFLKVLVPKGTPVSARKQKKIKGVTYQLGFGPAAQYGQEFDFTQKGFRFEFNYTVNLPYIVWNSFGPGLPELKKETPWHALDKGKDAFGKYILEKVPGKLGPLVARHIVAKVIR